MAFAGKDLLSLRDTIKPEALARNPQLEAYFREIGLIADPVEVEKAERATRRAQARAVESMLYVGKLIQEYEERFGTYNA